MYHLTINELKPLLCKEYYEEGETVELKIPVATDTNISVTSNDISLPSSTYDGSFICYRFKMPEHDIDIKVKNTPSMSFKQAINSPMMAAMNNPVNMMGFVQKKGMYKLSEHIYILPYEEENDRPNIGVIVSETDSLLYDLGCGPKHFAKLMSELSLNNLRLPHKAVISHYHWDHVFASGYTKIKLIGSKYTDEMIRKYMAIDASDFSDYIDDDKWLPRFCEEHIPMEYDDVKDIKLRPLDETFTIRKTIDLSGVTVELLEVVSPHDEGQVVAYVKEDKVLFLADANSGKVYGYDFFDDKEKREKFIEMLNEFDYEKVVLGHFNVMSRDEFLNDQKLRFEALDTK